MSLGTVMRRVEYSANRRPHMILRLHRGLQSYVREFWRPHKDPETTQREVRFEEERARVLLGTAQVFGRGPILELTYAM